VDDSVFVMIIGVQSQSSVMTQQRFEKKKLGKRRWSLRSNSMEILDIQVLCKQRCKNK